MSQECGYRPLRICLCTRFAPATGGIETLAQSLAREWSSLRHSVTVVTDVPRSGCDEYWGNFEVHRQPSRRAILALVSKSDLLVHLNISLKFLWPMGVTKARLIASHQSWYFANQRVRNPREAAKRWVARRLAANISCSHAVREALKCGGEVIPNSFDDVRFRLLGVPQDRDLVFVGRLVSDKGVDLLIEAMSLLHKRGARPSLTIVGGGPERRNLESLVRSHSLESQVEFMGETNHVKLPEILNRHRILVVPSLWDEPFGIVALEGAACGCVVVGSQGGGLPEAIGPCGVTFPNGDARQLAEKLAELLHDETALAQYRTAAPQHLARHTTSVIAQRYIEFFERTLN